MKNSSLKYHKKDRVYETILGVKVDSTSSTQLLSAIGSKIASKEKFYLVTPNPEIILQAQNDPDLSHSLNSADFSLPDGVGLKLAVPNLPIIKGRQFMLRLLELANTKKLKVYLLGGRTFVNKKALTVISSWYPNLFISGDPGPRLDKTGEPVSEVDTSLQFEVVRKINAIQPDLLFVAFGAPKQELWISKWREKLNVTGIMAIGGSLDYIAGVVKPVPKVLEELNLEWFWRLLQEPKRIGRIFNAVIVFPLKIILSKLSS